jgi:hypothetical protein
MARKDWSFKKKKGSGAATSGPRPTNPELYKQVKAEAMRKFEVWPSAYGSSWLVKEYKARGGKYK